MPLKIVKIEPRLARIVLIAAAILCIAAAWFFVRWNFANTIASRLDTQRPESKIVAEWLTQVAPDDPQTHFAAATIFEKTFDAGDLTKSLAEYEMAASLSPNDYRMWLNLGKSRNLNGDTDGADAAYRRAVELAPNYAGTHWAYGNFLVRQGNTDEGFALIAKAAASNPDYSRTGVVTAMQIFEGDLTGVRKALGDGDVTNAALAGVLASEKRFDEAAEAWSRFDANNKSGKFKDLGEKLISQFGGAKKFRLAARVSADLQTEGEKPTIGQIGNGGFEGGVKLRNAGLFEWNIAEGTSPQIGLSEGQKRSDKYSLFMLFNSFETAAFRSISQAVAVEPGAQYEFEAFYRNDIKSPATFKWEIADAATTGTIAGTPPLDLAGDWATLRVNFTVPAGSDGVIIRFVREGCGGPSCPTTGKISFDDISIRRL